jgi:iron complex transport system ATP-binding protein
MDAERTNSSLLRVRDLAWRAGTVPIVESVTFDVARGEFVALLGRNGAGKSTVMDILAGLRMPSAGSVLLDGRPLQAWTPRSRARRIAHLPQTVRTQSPMTVEQVVSMGRYPHADRWFESAADRAEVERAMAACGCLPFRGRRLSTLSGGERQRVLLAACFAQQPDLLLLDEPSTFLDIDHQLQSFAMLRARTDDGGACIAVTHDLNLALAFCTRLLVLADRTIACDLLAVAARELDDWLELFSARLHKVDSADGRSWVSYR